MDLQFDPPATAPQPDLLPAASAPAHHPSSFDVRVAPVPAALEPYVELLLAAEIGPLAPLPLFVAPHDSVMFSVHLGRRVDGGIESRGEPGRNTYVTGIREQTGWFVPTGRCISLYAALTPLGTVQVLDGQPLSAVPRVCARVDELLDRALTRQLECELAQAASLEAKLNVFAGWIESRVGAQRRLAPAALRAARAAMRVCDEPGTTVDDLADEAHVCRRQLERDFAHWIGTSPRHLAQVSRLQSVSRKAQRGAPLADIAADAGYVDQAHMSRVVRQLTGLTPRQFVRSTQTPLAAAFRAASGGGTVYL